MESNIELSFSFCELDNIADCAFGIDGFSLDTHDYVVDDLPIEFHTNYLSSVTYSQYDPEVDLFSSDFLNLGDCHDKDVYFSFTLKAPKRFNTLSSQDWFLSVTSGGTLPVDVGVYLWISGETSSGTNQLLTNTIEDFDQHINFGTPTLIETIEYERGESPILEDKHTLWRYSCDMDVQVMVYKRNYTIAIGFLRNCIFWIREKNCGSVVVSI